MRPIDADELKEKFSKISFSGLAAYGFGLAELHSGVSKMLEMIDEAPTVESVNHGRWLSICGGDGNECSECGMKYFGFRHKYCPWCGAKMDGE